MHHPRLTCSHYRGCRLSSARTNLPPAERINETLPPNPSCGVQAVDAAIDAIRDGKCTSALVCGVNVQLLPVWSEAFVSAGMLGASQRCHFGGDEADGYVRGEGVGAVFIRKLEDVPPEVMLPFPAPRPTKPFPSHFLP